MHQLTLCLFFHPPFFPVCLTHSPPYSYAPLSIYPSIFFYVQPTVPLPHTAQALETPRPSQSSEGHPYNSLASEVCPPPKELTQPSMAYCLQKPIHLLFILTLHHHPLPCMYTLTFILITSFSHTHTSVPTPSSVFTSCRHTPTHSHTGGFSSTLPVWLHTSSWITCYTTSPVMHSCATVPLVWLTLISFLP